MVDSSCLECHPHELYHICSSCSSIRIAYIILGYDWLECWIPDLPCSGSYMALDKAFYFLNLESYS